VSAPPAAAMEPMEFLRRHAPFDRLGAPALERVAASLEIAFCPRGTPILRRGDAPSESLQVIRKGAVRMERDGRLEQALEEGECFGLPSLLGPASPVADVTAAEDTLLYRIPAPVVKQLLETPAFAGFFLLDLAERLRRSPAEAPLSLGAELAIPARRVALAPPPSIAATATAGEAARAMNAARCSALLVDGTPPGILTDRDLRARVLAQGHGPEAPVARAMTAPARTLPAGASLFEALLFMLEHRVRHVPLVEAGSIVGLVSDTDLLRVQMRSPLHLMRDIERLRDPAAAAGYAGELAGMVEMLLWSGADPGQIGRIVARLNDALVRSLLLLAEADLGPPPSPWAWLVLGSEGRREQALIADQDNALAWGEDSPAARSYFPRLAERAIQGLLGAGFPPCPGGYMATRWHLPLAGWQRMLRGWMSSPTPQALVDAAVLCDFRPAHGELDLAPLEKTLRHAAGEPIFLAHMAKSALAFRPPLGLFRQVRAEDGGVDLKGAGIQPIVALARLLALAAGSSARSTLERLEAAAQAGTLSREGAANLGEAFRFLLRLRLRQQLAALRPVGGDRGVDGARGAGAGAEVAPGPARLEDLSSLERRYLKDTFLAIREVQEAMALRYGTERLP
jgi:CBS domain-containing protein